jgi:D-alanine-D-alanine ligase
MKYRRVGVLMGGWSAERDVSLKSGGAVADGLEAMGYAVARIDASRRLDEQLREARVDAVFIALHGRWGEDGTVQGMLEVMGIPYTGSPPLASALAIDKERTRDLLAAAGVRIAEGGVVRRGAQKELPPGLAIPVVVKPATEGSSVGVTIVHTAEELAPAFDAAWECADRAVVERYVRGAEINVAIVDGEVLGSVEIVPNREFYDYTAKYAPGGSTHFVPPRVAKTIIDEVERLGAAAYAALGCAGAARVDLIAPGDAPSIVLEVNTIPGMTRTSLLPEIAAHAGIAFPDLVARIVESARLHVGQ